MSDRPRGLTAQAVADHDVWRAVAAFGVANLAEWVLGTAVAIAALRGYGAAAVGLVGFRFVPAAFAGAWSWQLGRRHPPHVVMTATAGTRALLCALVAATVALGGPFAVVLVLVWLDAAVGSALRPAQAAYLPRVVGSPGILTAASTLCSNAKTAGQVLGALGGGVALAAFGAPAAIGVAGALHLAGAAATATVRQRPAASGGARSAAAGPALRSHPGAARLATWASVRALVRGLWTALGVVAAASLLGLGDAGYGLLMMAAGVGAVLSVPATQALVGRRRLAAPLAAALGLCGLPLAGVGTFAAALPAFVMLALWGFGMAASDVGAQALFHRIVPADGLPRAIAAMESGKYLAEGAGALVASGLLAVVGVRAGLIVTGAAITAAVLADLRRLLGTDVLAAGRTDALELLHGVAMFATLRLDALEAVAARTTWEDAPAGTVVVAQDEPGTRWYAVLSGRLDVLVDGYRINGLGAGDAFGERALLRGERRSASVIAATDTRLLSLDSVGFLAALAGPDAAVASPLPAWTGPVTARDGLARQPLLDDVDPTVLRGLEASARTVELPRGATVITAGERDDVWWVVLEGELVVRLDGAPERRLGPGDGVGEIAVLHGVPRTATVVAETGAVLLEVPGTALRDALGVGSARSGPQ